MSTRFSDTKRRFISQTHRCSIFRSKEDSPGGKGFRLKLHETKPDAPLSPYYFNFRNLRSFPSTAKATAVDLFEMMIEEIKGDVLADVPTAITPVVSSLSDRTQIPMITPRAPKDHGAGGSIDGIWPKGAVALLFDDLITEGHSTLEAAKVLWANNISVRHVIVFLDREQGGSGLLATVGLSLSAVFTISEILALYHEMRIISTDLYDEIKAYQAA